MRSPNVRLRSLVLLAPLSLLPALVARVPPVATLSPIVVQESPAASEGVSDLLPGQPSAEMLRMVARAAAKVGIDPEMGIAVVAVESRFNPRARSGAGAIGLAQVMPETARWMVSDITEEQLFEPELNLEIGFRHLRDLLDKYGDEHLALLAYNRGTGTVDRLLGASVDPDNGYADLVRRELPAARRMLCLC
jgi:soluble lytic murein transglycosylase-like protein